MGEIRKNVNLQTTEVPEELLKQLMSNSGRNVENQKELQMVKVRIMKFQTGTRALSAVCLKLIHVVVLSKGISLFSAYVLKN